MKARVKTGIENLFMEGFSNNWSEPEKGMVINFNNKGTFKSYNQKENHLHLLTTGGLVTIVFSSTPPRYGQFYYAKDQLVLLPAEGNNDFQRWLITKGYYRGIDNCWYRNGNLVASSELHRKLTEFKNQ